MVWDFPSESTVWTNRPIPALLGYSQQDIATTDDVPGRLIYREDQARFDAAMVAAHEADTGRGIAPHDFPRLFLPFDRIDADVNHIRGNRAGSDIVPRPDDSNGRNARSHLPGRHRQHLHRLPPTDPN